MTYIAKIIESAKQKPFIVVLIIASALMGAAAYLSGGIIFNPFNFKW
jgi:hypothetical protein